MERLTTRDKHGVAVMRLDLPQRPENNIIARLADYEDSGIAPDMVAVIGWIGRPAWILCMEIPGAKLKIVEGKVTQVFFGGRVTPKVEVMAGLTPYSDMEPENVFLTREDAEVALAQLMEQGANSRDA